MTETEFQRSVIELAQRTGWKVAHFRPAKTEKGWRTPVAADGAGFPDLVCLSGARIVVAELKLDGKQPPQKQREWLDAWAGTAAEVHVWRPRDWPHIERVFTGKPAERTPF